MKQGQTKFNISSHFIRNKVYSLSIKQLHLLLIIGVEIRSSLYSGKNVWRSIFQHTLSREYVYWKPVCNEFNFNIVTNMKKGDFQLNKYVYILETALLLVYDVYNLFVQLKC